MVTLLNECFCGFCGLVNTYLMGVFQVQTNNFVLGVQNYFSKSSCVGAYCNRPQDLSNPLSTNNGFKYRFLRLESGLIPRGKELMAEWKKRSRDNFRR